MMRGLVTRLSAPSEGAARAFKRLYINGLVENVKAYVSGYKGYRGVRDGVGVSKTPVGTGVEAPSSRAVCSFLSPSRHVVDHLVVNVGTSPARMRRKS